VSDVRKTTLPTDSKARKGIPLYSGPLKYFPAALAGVARICQVGNDKHNGPGTPLRHSRGLSMDHEDCIVRHLLDLLENHGAGPGRDESGVPQAYYIAWRALALAQRWAEENDGAPLAPGATVDEHVAKTARCSCEPGMACLCNPKAFEGVRAEPARPRRSIDDATPEEWDAARKACALDERKARKPEHNCGAQGFGRQGPGEPPDICRGCEAERRG